jgi:hypothetical protein
MANYRLKFVYEINRRLIAFVLFLLQKDYSISPKV